MANVTIEYLEALDRLKAKGINPTLDAVAIEAGRKKGSIRRGLARHAEIIAAIERAAEEFGKQVEQSRESKLARRVEKLIAERNQFKERYDILLADHLGAIFQLEEQRLEILELREKIGEKIAEEKAAGTLIYIVK